MKADVDRETCIGCGLCNSICPQVFEMTDEGIAKATEEELTDDLVACAKDAADQCPVSAIRVE